MQPTDVGIPLYLSELAALQRRRRVIRPGRKCRGETPNPRSARAAGGAPRRGAGLRSSR